MISDIANSFHMKTSEKTTEKKWYAPQEAAERLGMGEDQVAFLSSHGLVSAVPSEDGVMYAAFEVDALAGEDQGYLNASLEKYRSVRAVMDRLRERQAEARRKLERELGQLQKRKAAAAAANAAYRDARGGIRMWESMCGLIKAMYGSVRTAGLMGEEVGEPEYAVLSRYLNMMTSKQAASDMGIPARDFEVLNETVLKAMNGRGSMLAAQKVREAFRDSERLKLEKLKNEKLRNILREHGIEYEE